MDGEITGFILALVVVGVPVLGFTARFALKPIVESIVRLRESFDRHPPGTDMAALRYELTSLREEMQELREAVQQLEEGSRFFAQLKPETETARLEAGPTT